MALPKDSYCKVAWLVISCSGVKLQTVHLDKNLILRRRDKLQSQHSVRPQSRLKCYLDQGVLVLLALS